MPERNLTLFDLIGDSVGSFLQECEFGGGLPAKRLLVELITALIGYEEEQEKLSPCVLIVGPDVDPKALFANSHLIEFGRMDLGAGTAGHILKRLARLVDEGSMILLSIENGGAGVKLAVLDHGLTSANPPPAHYLLPVGEEDPISAMHAMYLVPQAGRRLEVVTPKGQYSLDLRGAIAQPRTDHFVQFAAGFELPEDVADKVRWTVVHALESCKTAGHGCLLLMTEETWADDFSDSVPLSPPLKLVEIACSNSMALDRVARLMSGMLSTDLATLVDKTGTIQAFRVYVPPTEGVPDEGGARLRAFHSSHALPTVLTSLYMSQDGPTRIWNKP